MSNINLSINTKFGRRENIQPLKEDLFGSAQVNFFTSFTLMRFISYSYKENFVLPFSLFILEINMDLEHIFRIGPRDVGPWQFHLQKIDDNSLRYLIIWTMLRNVLHEQYGNYHVPHENLHQLLEPYKEHFDILKVTL